MRKLFMLTTSILLGILIFAGILGSAKAQAGAQAVVTLNRLPAPPDFVQPGQAMLFSWTIEFSTTPFSYTLAVFDKSIAEGGGNRLLYQVNNAGGATSPITGAMNWTVPATVTLDANPDSFRVELDFYSDFPTGLESQARQVFLVGFPTPTPTPTPIPPEPTPQPTEPPPPPPTNTPIPTSTPTVSPSPAPTANATPGFPTLLPETGSGGGGTGLLYLTLVVVGGLIILAGKRTLGKQ